MTRILINECKKIYNYNRENSEKIVNIEEKINYTTSDEGYSFVNEALSYIENDLKEVCVLYYYDGFSVNEIAKLLNIPEGTIKYKLFMVRKKLSTIIEKEDLL